MEHDLKEMVGFYVPYIMGILDTLVRFECVLSAVDMEDLIELTLLSIARDVARVYMKQAQPPKEK